MPEKGVRYSVTMSTQITEHGMKVAEARNVLGEVISRAHFAGEPTIFVNRRKDMAVLVSYEFYERATEALGLERHRVEDSRAKPEPAADA